MIATGLKDYLAGRGHRVRPIPGIRSRWIYWRPWLWPLLLRDRGRHRRSAARLRPDLWLTYHTYYKAPDLLGPAVCRALGLPYVVFQGMYSTKRRRDPRTMPGFILNRRALAVADHVFANRREDLVNLRRILPEDKLTYVRPGILSPGISFTIPRPGRNTGGLGAQGIARWC